MAESDLRNWFESTRGKHRRRWDNGLMNHKINVITCQQEGRQGHSVWLIGALPTLRRECIFSHIKVFFRKKKPRKQNKNLIRSAISRSPGSRTTRNLKTTASVQPAALSNTEGFATRRASKAGNMFKFSFLESETIRLELASLNQTLPTASECITWESIKSLLWRSFHPTLQRCTQNPAQGRQM